MSARTTETKTKKKTKMKKRTKFTIFAMFNIIWYTVVVLIINALGQEVQSELTVAWFSSWSVELALLAGIKIKSRTNDEGE